MVLSYNSLPLSTLLFLQEKEIKVILIIIASTITAVISLFKTSLVADIIMFLALVALTVLIVNKEFKLMINKIASMLKKPKNSNEG